MDRALLATLGISVADAVSGSSSLNIAAMSWSTSSSRLRRGLSTVSIVRVPVASVAVVIVHLLSACDLWPCRLRPLAGKEERPPPDGRRPFALSWDGYEGAGGPVVSGDGPSLQDAGA